ncbi:MAG: DUF2341 domain-containing protein, partial [Bacteroidota bacterium]
TLQWQSSLDNANWTDIPGETTDVYTAGPVGVPTFFRVQVTFGCTVSSVFFLVTLPPPPPFVGDYAFRQRLIIPAANVEGSNDLIDFPVLVKTVDEELRDFVQNPNGYDIAFTEVDGTPLDHDLEYFNPTTGELIAWVRIPTLSHSNDTEFFMYFGDGSIVSDMSVPSTWEVSYEGVYHLNDNYLDATSNAYHATNNGTVFSPASVGNGALFDATADEITTSNTTNSSQYTISGWISPSAFGNQFPRVVEKDGVLRIMVNNNAPSGPIGAVRFIPVGFTGGNDWWSTTHVSPGSTYYLTITYDGSNFTNDPKFYFNGIEEAFDGVNTTQPTGGSFGISAAPWIIGNDPVGNRNWSGLIDEFRIANTIRTADWIATEYHNQNDPQDFVQFDFTESSAFITTWKTMSPGESITIPTTGGGYNYDVDWGDGSDDVGVAGNIGHTYTNAGEYEVVITGAFPRIYFNNQPGAEKIISVDNWGSQVWASMENAFS